MNQVSVVIPAYQPSDILVDLAARLISKQRRVIVVNDGSTYDHQFIFEQLTQLGVIVLEHSNNRGKGAALKTAFNYWLKNCSNECGIITADADGQHAIEDIIKLSEALQANPYALHLGSRKFAAKTIPWRSRFGNKLTAKIFQLCNSQAIHDTQTGLRAIPKSLINKTINCDTDGYQFEIEMLLIATREKYQITEHNIKTIYIDDNSSSHFRPILDSVKIYWVIVRYLVVAISSFAIDFAMFSILHLLTKQIFFSLCVARIISASYNFMLNKNVVFQSKGNILNPAIKYLCLMLTNIFLATLLVSQLHLLGISVYFSKLISDIFLLALNFWLQNSLVFRN